MGSELVDKIVQQKREKYHSFFLLMPDRGLLFREKGEHYEQSIGSSSLLSTPLVINFFCFCGPPPAGLHLPNSHSKIVDTRPTWLPQFEPVRSLIVRDDQPNKLSRVSIAD